MLKLVVLLTVVTALAASASLKVSPSELRLIWDTIEEDLKLQQNTSELEIRNLFDPLSVLIDDAKTKLASDIQEANRAFQQQIKAIEDEHPGQNISGCAEIAQVELKLIDEELLSSISNIHEQLEKKAEEELERAINVTADALEQLEVLKERVDLCNDNACASELNIEVVAFYEKIIKDLNGAVEIANNAVLIQLGAQLDATQLNQQNYQQDLDKLLEEVRSCIATKLLSANVPMSNN